MTPAQVGTTGSFLAGYSLEGKRRTANVRSHGSPLAQKSRIAQISGTAKLNHLEENFGAASVELTTDDLRET
jgi:hypothetical protein